MYGNIMKIVATVVYASSLWEMNRKIGTIADYLPLILNGFPEDVLSAAGYNPSQVRHAVANMQHFFSDPIYQLNQELFSCL